MIRHIVAIDSKNGLANEHGIPWQGKLPTDVKYFRDKTIHSFVLMGWVTYLEFEKPLSDRKNYVLSRENAEIRDGFEIVTNLDELLTKFANNSNEHLWIIGGAGVFAKTINQADELYVTRLDGDFGCTKFYPKIENNFDLKVKTKSQSENDINFSFEIWSRK